MTAWLREEWGRLRWSFGGGRRGYLTGWAWLRATLDRHLLRYETEHCQRCGRRVGLVWWCTDATAWRLVSGSDGGLRCVRCFDREARAVGRPVLWLAVTREEFDRQVQAYYDGIRETSRIAGSESEKLLASPEPPPGPAPPADPELVEHRRRGDWIEPLLVLVVALTVGAVIARLT